jgi:hypothetical protein
MIRVATPGNCLPMLVVALAALATGVPLHAQQTGTTLAIPVFKPFSADAFIARAFDVGAQIDKGLGAQVYDAASVVMRNQVERDEFLKSLPSPAGTARQRQLLTLARSVVPPAPPSAQASQVPPGTYVAVMVLAMLGDENRREVITFRDDEDGKTRLAGFYSYALKTAVKQPPAAH